MLEITKEVKYLVCQRCGREWQPRVPINQIRQCPGCHTIAWRTPPKNKIREQKINDELPVSST